MLVRDVMRPAVLLPEDTAEMGMAEAEMRIADVRHVLIVDADGRLAGIISRGDVLRAEALTGHHPVREYMTRRVFAVKADAPAVAALDLLTARGVGAVPVIDDDERPIGLVSESDYLKIARRALS
jgi:CBS domain-containing membrane protein